MPDAFQDGLEAGTVDTDPELVEMCQICPWTRCSIMTMMVWGAGGCPAFAA
jgi:hypothetical protein